VNYQQKKYEQAISDLSVVIKNHPNDKQALQFRSICKDSIGDTLGAIEDREIAEEIVDLPEASIRVHGIVDEEYIEKGDQWVNAGNYEKGIQYYSQVIELSPSKFEPYFKRAYAYLDLGEIEKAMHDLKIADSLQPNNASILAEIAYCHYYREETKKGLEYCKEALAIDELHPAANYYAGMLELQAENHEEGLDFLLKAISLGYDTVLAPKTVGQERYR
jgi:tetratricopeptide (TPR) repeat protein